MSKVRRDVRLSVHDKYRLIMSSISMLWTKMIVTVPIIQHRLELSDITSVFSVGDWIVWYIPCIKFCVTYLIGILECQNGKSTVTSIADVITVRSILVLFFSTT